jgi:hypothetical protein
MSPTYCREAGYLRRLIWLREDEENYQAKPQGGDASPGALPCLLRDMFPGHYRSINCVFHSPVYLLICLCARAPAVPVLLYQLPHSHVPFHKPSSNNFKRAFSTATWRARNSEGHLRRTWVLLVPVRANKLAKIPASLPIRAIHILSKCECDFGAL